MIKNLVYENIEFKINAKKNELEILKTIIKSPFNKNAFQSAFTQIVKRYPKKSIKYYVGSTLEGFKDIINILKNNKFKFIFKKIVYNKKIKSVDEPKGLNFKTLNEVGKSYFLKIYEYCLENTRDEDFNEDKKNIRKSFDSIINKEFPDWNVIAFDKKEIVGLVIMQDFGNYCSINFVTITPKNKGKGYSKLLLQKAEFEFFKNRKKQWLESTSENNLEMRNVFEKYGFKKIRELLCFKKN